MEWKKNLHEYYFDELHIWIDEIVEKKCYDKVKFASIGYILSLSLSFAFAICILKADISFLCVVIDLPL